MDKNLKLHWLNTLKNEVDERLEKEHLLHHCPKKVSIYPIIGLTYINFDCYRLPFAFLIVLEPAECLKTQKDVVRNQSSLQKRCLFFNNHRVEHYFESTSKHLCNYLINILRKMDRLEISGDRELVHLGIIIIKVWFIYCNEVCCCIKEHTITLTYLKAHVEFLICNLLTKRKLLS